MPNNVSIRAHWAGVIILIIATIIWASTFVVTKQAVGNLHVPPSVMMAARFGVAVLLFLPFFRGGRRLWLVGLEVSLWEWLGYATQTIGLQYTTASRSAFITCLSVVLIPLFHWATGKPILRRVWLAAVLAFVGVGLLSYDGSAANRGDLWTLLTAAFYGYYIVRLEKVSDQFPSLPLTALQLLGVLLLSSGWAGVQHPAWTFKIPWPAVIYLGIAATALTTFLQTLSQRWITAPEAAIIFTLEPVWAAGFAFVILHERFGMQGWIGGGLVLMAALLSQWPGRQLPPAQADASSAFNIRTRPN